MKLPGGPKHDPITYPGLTGEREQCKQCRTVRDRDTRNDGWRDGLCWYCLVKSTD